MQRTISTRTHGVIDYTWASAAAAIPERMNGAATTARLVRNAGMAASMTSMLTNYEAGVVRVLPMKAHLTIDLLMSSLLIASPLFLPPSERRWAAVPVALGIVGLLASLMTDRRSPLEDEYAIAHDPDIARDPHLRAHLE